MPGINDRKDFQEVEEVSHEESGHVGQAFAPAGPPRVNIPNVGDISRYLVYIFGDIVK